MRLKKGFKKVLTITMAAAMMFTMSAVSFADEANPANDTNAYYYQTDDAAIYQHNSDITVNITIESKKASGKAIAERSIPVTLDVAAGETNKKFSVRDALYELQNNTAYDSYGIDFLDRDGNLLEPTDTYFYSVRQNGNKFGPGFFTSFDGWMVRVNGRFTIDAFDSNVGGLRGESINNMLLKDGDDVHVYMDNTQSESKCANFTRIDVSKSNDEMTFSIEASHNYFDSNKPYTWHISQYVAYAGANGKSLKILDSNGNVVTTTTILGNTASINTANLTPGTYTVVLDGKYGIKLDNKVYTMAYSNFTV